MARNWKLTHPGASGNNLAFAALRVAVSAVLIWGALTKIFGGDRLAELAARWAAAGLPQPQLLVSTSIALQLMLALLLLVGLFTRMAGLLNGLNFAAAAAVSGIFASGSHWWPFALLIVLLLHFGIVGAGKLSIDEIWWRRRAQRSLEDLLTSMGIKPQPEDGNYPGQGRG